jgi:hypothetical protein
MKRIIAANKTGNLMHALERLCWSDCHKGVSYGWIDKNIHKKYHVSNNTCRYLIDIGFIEKRDNLYFHTGITPSQEVVQKLLNHKRNRESCTWKSPANQVDKNLFDEQSSNSQELTLEFLAKEIIRLGEDYNKIIQILIKIYTSKNS